MKLVILAGGKGTRLSEETSLKPKPMINIGNMPIIWHIMKHYSCYGINEFVICCGYKANIIKNFFSNYSTYYSDVTLDYSSDKIIVHKKRIEDWKITLVDTGEDTLTGGRILRIKKYVNDNFCLTYGDGLSNIDIKKLINFHYKHKKIATVSIVKPLARFGSVEIDSKNKVMNFREKYQSKQDWINGGFFVLRKEIFRYLKNDNTIFEQEPMQRLAKQQQLMAYKHQGFWQPMDTLREKQYLEMLWHNNKAPWKLW